MLNVIKRFLSSSMQSEEVYDAIVVGGGPAGATCAYKLAAEGHSVLLLEKARFPRFHIGESMVAYLSKLFEMIEFDKKVEQNQFVGKPGVEFFSATTGELRRQNFCNLAEGQNKFSYNLDRPRFDELLLEHAKETGANVLQEADVKNFLFEENRIVGVEYQYQGQRYQAQAQYVVDASGRAGLISKKLNLRKMNSKLENVAVFQHYTDVVKDNNPGVEGDVLFSGHKDGWLWGIPIEDDTISVGAVMPLKQLKQSGPEEIFKLHLDRAPRIKQAIKDAKQVFDKPKVELDFCYYTEKFAGPGYFLAGDAACFVDPLFSGGLYISMVGGMKAAEAINDIFEGKDEKEVANYFENFCKTGYDSYFRVAYSFYYEYGKDMNRMVLELPGGFHFVLQVFAGDFWADEDHPVMQYLRSKKEYDTFELPFDPIYECPIYPDTHYKAADIPYLTLPDDFQPTSATEKTVAAE